MCVGGFIKWAENKNIKIVNKDDAILYEYNYIKNNQPQPKIILSQEGIQLVGQPFVSWALVHGLHIKPEVKKNVYIENLIFVNNGRIQEIPIHKLEITSWQLEHLLEIYQGRFRYGSVTILPDDLDESELTND